MSRHTVAIIILAVLTVFLFVNRSTITLQQYVIPVAGVGLVIWLAVRYGAWQSIVSNFSVKPRDGFQQQGYEGTEYPSSSSQNEQPSSEFPFELPQASPNGGRGDTPMMYTIKVSRDTEWKPELAISLIREFVSIGHLALRIASEGNEVFWQVIDLGKTPLESGLITKVVRKVFPDAEVIPAVYEPKPFNGRFYRVVETYTNWVYRNRVK